MFAFNIIIICSGCSNVAVVVITEAAVELGREGERRGNGEGKRNPSEHLILHNSERQYNHLIISISCDEYCSLADYYIVIIQTN